jgi:hypothetical protein
MITRILLTGVLSMAICATVMAQEQAPETAAPAATLQNGGFESPDISKGAEQLATPDSWFHFSSTPERKAGVSDARKRSGSQSLCFKAQAPQDAFQGLAYKFNAVAGKPYSFTVYIMSDPADPLVGAAFGQLSFEWRDATGKELSRTYGPTWNFELSSTRWEKITVDADAPDGATEGSAVITSFAKDCKGVGSFFADDAELICRGN